MISKSKFGANAAISAEHRSSYLITWIIILLQIRMGQSLFYFNSLMRIESQHFIQQIKSQREENYEISVLWQSSQQCYFLHTMLQQIVFMKQVTPVHDRRYLKHPFPLPRVDHPTPFHATSIHLFVFLIYHKLINRIHIHVVFCLYNPF